MEPVHNLIAHLRKVPNPRVRDLVDNAQKVGMGLDDIFKNWETIDGAVKISSDNPEEDVTLTFLNQQKE